MIDWDELIHDYEVKFEKRGAWGLDNCDKLIALMPVPLGTVISSSDMHGGSKILFQFTYSLN